MVESFDLVFCHDRMHKKTSLILEENETRGTIEKRLSLETFATVCALPADYIRETRGFIRKICRRL